MRNKSYICLILLFPTICLVPLKMASQNKYVVNVIQPSPPVSPAITYVSNSNDNKDKIVWDKLDPMSFLYVDIYRESEQSSGEWELIAKENTQSTSEYIDQSSEPAKHAYRYRISGIDKCGSETSLCNPHRTIKLSIVKTNARSYLLTWNPYEGKSIQFYNIYKGISSDSLQLIASSITTQYHDTTSLPKDDSFYRVEAELTDEDNGSSKSPTLLNESWSNIISITSESNTTYKTELLICPNPSSVHTTIFFPNPLGRLYQVAIYDLTGRLVFTKTISTSQIEVNRENLKAGMYLVRIMGEQFYEGKMLVNSNF